MIKKIIILIGISFFLFISCNKETKMDEKSLEEYHQEFKKYTSDYLTGLKAVLKRNIKIGGPIKGVTVCADTASDLTDMFSDAIELKVKRVSFKNRNPNNVPDEIEAKVLHKYEALLKKNKLTSGTETFGKYNLNGKEILRYMKPIIIEKKCLVCHGNKKTIPKNVSKFLKIKYPNDKATNYSVGELRGVISITKEL